MPYNPDGQPMRGETTHRQKAWKKAMGKAEEIENGIASKNNRAAKRRMKNKQARKSRARNR